jgi:hypothetical protein
MKMKTSDVATPRSPLFVPKIILKIGYWNVRTMFQIGKTTQICGEINNYGLDILGISESRWTESGKSFLSEDKTHIIIISGRNDSNHSEGVAILMTNEPERSLRFCSPGSSSW